MPVQPTRDLLASPFATLAIENERVNNDMHREAIYWNSKLPYKDSGAPMTTIFTDGMEIKTSGPYRIIHEADGVYVVGEGLLYPVATQDEAKQTLRELLLKNTRSSIKSH